MVDRVGSDRDAQPLEVRQLRPGEEARVRAGDPLGDHELGRGHVPAVQYGCGLPEDVAVAVVEGDHHRLRRQPLPVLERLERLQRAHGVVAVCPQPGHLRREVLRAHGQALGDRRQGRQDRPDPVIHQHGQLDRPVGKGPGETQVAGCCGRADECKKDGEGETAHRGSLPAAGDATLGRGGRGLVPRRRSRCSGRPDGRRLWRKRCEAIRDHGHDDEVRGGHDDEAAAAPCAAPGGSNGRRRRHGAARAGRARHCARRRVAGTLPAHPPRVAPGADHGERAPLYDAHARAELCRQARDRPPLSPRRAVADVRRRPHAHPVPAGDPDPAAVPRRLGHGTSTA